MDFLTPADATALSPPSGPPADGPDDGIPVVTPLPEPYPFAGRPVARPIRRPTARAVARPARRRVTARPVVASVVPLLLTVGVFAGMMAVSFGQAAYSLATARDVQTLTEPAARTHLVNQTLLVEGVDTLLVLGGLLLVGRPPAGPRPPARWLAWLLSVPGFGLLFGLNLTYHLVLRTVFAGAADPDVTTVSIGLLTDGWWAVLLICVQPAVVEELFFRRLLFGHLRPHLGTHAAVAVSAVVFGMAHLGGVASWPVLVLLGAGLGYARAYSGGLALPVLLHFLHNLAVLGVQAAA